MLTIIFFLNVCQTESPYYYYFQQQMHLQWNFNFYRLKTFVFVVTGISTAVANSNL